jgi:twitching motility protein PilT
VRAQLADCLVAVVCQRLRFRPDLKIRVPECEILIPTIPIKSFIRNGDFFKIVSAMETGADHGMWTWQRYQTWLDNKKVWHFPSPDEKPDSEPTEAAPVLPMAPPPLSSAAKSKQPVPEPPLTSVPASPIPRQASRIEIEPVEGGLEELIKKLEH